MRMPRKEEVLAFSSGERNPNKISFQFNHYRNIIYHVRQYRHLGTGSTGYRIAGIAKTFGRGYWPLPEYWDLGTWKYLIHMQLV